MFKMCQNIKTKKKIFIFKEEKYIFCNNIFKVIITSIKNCLLVLITIIINSSPS